MTTRCKYMGLTLPQAELLKTLFDLERQTKKGIFWKPRELGGYRCSHHALTLKRLHAQGLVERTTESGKTYAYRIAENGISLWSVIQESTKLPSAAIFGGAQVLSRAAPVLKLLAPA